MGALVARGQITIVDLHDGVSYTLNINGGVRGIAYAADGSNPDPTTNTATDYTAEVLKNGVKVEPYSYAWTTGGCLSGGGTRATFRPIINTSYVSGNTFVTVKIKETRTSDEMSYTIPVVCTKHADGLDWIGDWNGTVTDIKGNRVVTPKLFAGKNTGTSVNPNLTGVAVGLNVLDGNDKTTGIVGYKNNDPRFKLDTEGNFFVGSGWGAIESGSGGGLKYDAEKKQLNISGSVKMTTGSTIGNKSAEELLQDVISKASINDMNTRFEMTDGKINAGVSESKAYADTKDGVIKEEVRVLGADLSIAKNQISLKVEQTDIDKTVSNVVIGGRNYIILDKINTSAPYTSTSVDKINKIITVTKLNSNGYITMEVKGFVPIDTTHVLSGIATLDGIPITESFFVTKRANTYSSGTTTITVDKNGKFEIVETYNGTSQWILHTHVQGGVNSKIVFKNLKFEIGTKPTDYTPAPEDTDKAIADTVTLTEEKIKTAKAEIKIETDKINLEVGKTNSVVTSHTSSINAVDGKINTAKGQAVTEAVGLKDRRNNNDNPQYYFTTYPKRTVEEFKFATVIGIPNAIASKYGVCTTIVPWTEPSGGYPTQTFRSDITPTFERKATSTTAWGSWVQIEDTAGSQNKATQALNTSKTYTETKVSEAQASIKLTTDSIKQSVSSVDTKVNTVTVTANNALTNANKGILDSLTATELAKALSTGKMLNTDPTFRNGVNGTVLYNNGNNGNVSLTRIAKPTDCPTTSTHCMEVKSIGVGNPNFGGFYFGTATRANAIFITKIVAKIPTGRSISFATNNMGTGGSQKWLTPVIGTGKYEEYVSRVISGSTGSFSSTNFFSVSGGSTPTASSPLTWQIAYATVFDLTDNDETLNTHTTQISNTNTKVSTIETNLSSITQRVSSTENTTKTLDGKVVAVDNRLKTAENKITDSAIVNTVKASQSNGKNTFAQTSTVEQLVNQVKFDFSSSGGYNYLKNGQFLNGHDFWWYHEYASTGTNKSVGVITPNSEWCLNGRNAIQIRATWNNQGMYGVAQTVTLKHNTTYTLSGYFASHRCQGKAQIQRNGGDWLVCNWKTLEETIGGKNDASWNKFTVTFTTSNSGISDYNIGIYIEYAAQDGYAWYTDLMLEEGTVKTKYTPNQNEIYSGNTIIDAGGVTINNGALRVKNNAGQEVISADSAGNLWIKNNMTVGGNTHGSVDVKNSSGVTIFTASQNGTFVKDGVMKITNGNVSNNGINYPSGSEYETTLRGYGSDIQETSYAGSQIYKAKASYHGSGVLLTNDNSGNSQQTVINTHLRYNGLSFGADTNDQANGSPWYGIGRMNIDIGGGGSAIQLAGYWGLRLRSSSSGIDLYSYRPPKMWTPHGYLFLGPQNDSHCHYETDRDNHWFNKRIIVNGNIELYGSSNLFIAKNNYGYTCADNGGTARYAIYIDASNELKIGYNGERYINSYGHFMPAVDNSYYLGAVSPNRRWKQLCAVAGSINGSDSSFKQNIRPILKNQKEVKKVLRSRTNPFESKSFHVEMPKEDNATGNDFYNFMKDTFTPYAYDYKMDEPVLDRGIKEFSTGKIAKTNPIDDAKQMRAIGFVADEYDIANDKVAKEFIFRSTDGKLNYNTANYTTVVAIALKEAIDEIEELKIKNGNLQTEIKTIKKHLGIA